MEAKNVSQLVEKIKGNDAVRSNFLQNPLGFLETVSDEKPIENKAVFLIIMGIVGSVLLAVVVMSGVIIFNASNTETAKVPEFLVAIGSTALGALVGLLAPNPAGK